MNRDKLIFEHGAPDRRCVAFPAAEDSDTAIPETMRRDVPPGLPEVSELELIRHYTALSQMNFSIDTQFLSPGILYHEIQSPEYTKKRRAYRRSRDCIPYPKMPNPPCKFYGKWNKYSKPSAEWTDSPFNPQPERRANLWAYH